MNKEIWKDCLLKIAYGIEYAMDKKCDCRDRRSVRIFMGSNVYFEGRDFTFIFGL